MESSPLSYTLEKFRTGCRILAIHPGRPRDRLLDAYRSQIMHAHPPEPDIPAAIAKRIEGLHARLTSAPDRGGGTIAASVGAMSDDETRECTDQIWSINSDLHSVARRLIEHRDHPIGAGQPTIEPMTRQSWHRMALPDTPMGPVPMP